MPSRHRLTSGWRVAATFMLLVAGAFGVTWLFTRDESSSKCLPMAGCCPTGRPKRSQDVADYAWQMPDTDVVFVGQVKAVLIRPYPFTPEAWRSRADSLLLAVYTVNVLETIKGAASGLVLVEQPENLPIHCPNDFLNDTLAIDQNALFLTDRVGGVLSLHRGAMSHVPLPTEAAASDVVATIATIRTPTSTPTPK